jgi:hypothetical protein
MVMYKKIHEANTPVKWVTICNISATVQIGRKCAVCIGHLSSTRSVAVSEVVRFVCMYKGGPLNPTLAPRPSMIYCASLFN